MFAIVCSGNKQFKVSSGDLIRVPYLAGENPQATLQLQPVAVEEGVHFLIGSEELKKTSVTAKVLRHGLSKKTLVFKKKRRKGYRKTRGHRQAFTELRIIEIKLPSGKVLSLEKLKKGASKKKITGEAEEASKAKNLKEKAVEKDKAQKTASDKVKAPVKESSQAKKPKKTSPPPAKAKADDKKKSAGTKTSLKTTKTADKKPVSRPKAQKTAQSKDSVKKPSVSKAQEKGE
ncbi:MAG: 50S ribosomal protein L21 [Bdellovibrionales bacterium]|nr:50S ribosomal protein L21 [Bdellovibrionales bacterium]